ncbi:MAG: hypothetical protein K0S65_4987 [Labilithrix sp.]|nr:hypothetical protein [Labilithrix sp.]
MIAGGSRTTGESACSRINVSDRQLALLLGVGLFVLVGWPLLFLRIPPYQDLPGHLAAVTILANPSSYPEFVPTGFLKPNSFFFLWTLVVGRSFGFIAAAKAFTLGVLAATAIVLPRFVLHFTDRKRMLLATPLLVPMVHHWFVSMGMLNFAASVPVALLLLIALDRRIAAKPSERTRLTLETSALALLSWYLHPFPVMTVGLMVVAAAGAELMNTRGQPLRERFTLARAALPSLVPPAAMAMFVFMRHVAAAAPKMEAPVFSSLQWALYNLWSQWMYGFTELTAATVVPAIVLAVVAGFRWREGRALLGPAPLIVLVLAYLLGPYVAFDANYITPRLIPFLWAAALVRLPARLPRPIVGALVVAAAIYLVGMPIDLFRLSRELDAFAAGAPAVPEGARLLPLNFNARVTSKNTFSLGTAWGLYVLERHTSAVDAWANVPSMPIMLRTPLPQHLEPMARLRFIRDTRTREVFCADRRSKRMVTVNCEEQWRDEWDMFWREALPSFDQLLLWDPPSEVRETVPESFVETFVEGRLHILTRRPTAKP